jgi:hypothetical protein
VSFFVWLIEEGHYDRGNPVVSRMHRRLLLAPPDSLPEHQEVHGA